MKLINAHSKQMIIVAGFCLTLGSIGRAAPAVPALPDDSAQSAKRKMQEQVKSTARELAKVRADRRLLEKRQKHLRCWRVYRDQSGAAGDFEAIPTGVPTTETLHQGWVSFGTSLILFSVATSTAFLV
jgi:hypothetical protein